eukprot:TRINITY_DN6957_c0_g1_i1.p1 TRINITY_DN6957_c0_g1~~TRINITY_DN6957_c0_g1_i1.p1  ORF type:complete len:441 (+),score=73.77 TRINITY_DN6957_c0_g1_i1:121-1443(+)
MDVINYLVSLPSGVLEELYRDPWTCQAVFRSLPSLAKQYIVRFLYTGTIPQQSVDGWVKPEEATKHRKAIERLSSLKLVTPSLNSLTLNPAFQEQMKDSLSKGSITESASTGESGGNVTEAKLEEVASQYWEALLHFILGTPTRTPSDQTRQLLIDSQLIKLDAHNNLKITTNGFQFLLKDTRSQIWTLLLSYLNTVENRDMNKKEVISFLFQLSFLTFGKAYPIDSLTPTQQLVLQDLREFGLVYKRKSSSKRYYPTKLAVTLSSMDQIKATNTNDTGKGFIVLESNYRVYAYTTSELQIQILRLFVGMRYRLPNMVMGVIARDNIREALINGIRADQIISYLRQNLHPQMLNNKPPMPETVTDQIRLWEQERNRVSYSQGVLYDSFPNADAFNRIVQYAKDTGCFIWANFEIQKLMVTDSGHEQVLRAWIKKNITGRE